MISVESWKYHSEYPETNRFCEMHLSVLFHGFHSGDQWGYKNMAAPYWRFYWNPVAGASVTLAQSVISLKPSHVYVIPAGTQFSSLSRGTFSQFFIHFALSGDFDRVNGGVYAFALTQERRKMIQGIRQLSERKALDGYSGTLTVQRLLLDVLPELPQETWVSEIEDPRIHAMVQIMKKLSFDRHPSNAELAAEAHLGTNSFVRLFSRQMKLPPQQFLVNRRLDRAAILLRFSTKSIESIAEECGFCDRFHLSKMFKLRFAVGPAHFRRRRQH